MIRDTKKIDSFITKEAKGVKEMLKTGAIHPSLVTLEIFIDNLIEDFQIDESQIDYTKGKSKEILQSMKVEIQGL
ncbi:hypothetical protein [Flammeovirga kamogawensis]|uniref:Uncharacterized protein n=1 Tax=Flammeovirga kamogawensis TaxID=373891 RepID=A0ABX8GX52_9BACT|nr:hypothetical protein [Flammeovirga kamogawensis]MBB6460624.1 hypothetical protein [Flammeovirga kamogawensis]QWG07979.1 hypothetical protein KM029_03330 [Flammeovirga kamogawensis]TRX69786.1 hypothetical protein EO216_17265 [Flammeovirga kamogawensis]